MKIVLITSYDCQHGQPDAVVKMPDGMSEDEVYTRWCRETRYGYDDKTDQELLSEATDVWYTYEVEELDL
jgi:hypothetical protein